MSHVVSIWLRLQERLQSAAGSDDEDAKPAKGKEAGDAATDKEAGDEVNATPDPTLKMPINEFSLIPFKMNFTPI